MPGNVLTLPRTGGGQAATRSWGRPAAAGGMLLPFGVLYVLFLVLPSLYALLMSFFQTSLVRPGLSAFAGIDSRAEATPGCEIEVSEGQHHDDAKPLHDVDVEADTAKSAEAEENHGIAARQQRHDARPHPWEEAAEDAAPEREALRRFERSGGGTEHLMSEKHAAHPNDRRKDVEKQADDHHRDARTHVRSAATLPIIAAQSRWTHRIT